MSQRCLKDKCREKALSLSDFCWSHTDNKQEYLNKLSEHIKSEGSIKNFYLRYAELTNFDFIDVDCEAADFTFCNLSGANFSGANMTNCNLAHANMNRSYLDNANFANAHMLGCNLSESRLWHADFKNTNLTEADMREADFLHANLSQVKFWNVNLKGAKLLSRHNFLTKAGRIFTVYEIDESGFVSASEGYRNLKQYFISEGRYDDASWASFKEKYMQRKQLLKERNIAFLPSLLMDLMSGYGEKPYRVILFSIAVICMYAVLYYLTDALNVSAAGARNLWDCLYFSVVTFTTLGLGDITPRLLPFFQMLVGSEAFIGAFTMGLFVFTLARKYSAR